MAIKVDRVAEGLGLSQQSAAYLLETKKFTVSCTGTLSGGASATLQLSADGVTWVNTVSTTTAPAMFSLPSSTYGSNLVAKYCRVSTNASGTCNIAVYVSQET